MKQLYTITLMLLIALHLFAQHEPIQPYQDLGIKVKVLTLSNGKYQESFPNDTLHRIGSVLFNRVTGEVETVVIDTILGEYSLRADVPSRWLSPDPLAAKFPEWSPYTGMANNPVKFIDKDGREPIEPLVGTIEQAINFFRAEGLNTVEAIQNFFANPVDENGERFDYEEYTKYIYTEDRGWIDLRHFFGGLTTGEGAMDAWEVVQCARGKNSCYSYEDLPSNDFSADSRNALTALRAVAIGETQVPAQFLEGEALFTAVANAFDEAGATSPQSAPNYSELPTNYRPKVPSVKGYELVGNGSGADWVAIPYTQKEKEALIRTGKYAPQNFSEEPLNLDNFPTPSKKYEQKQ